MSMEIRGVGPYYDIPTATIPGAATQQAASQAAGVRTSQPQQHIDKVLSDLQRVTQAFNRRLQFSVDRDINRVIVKVIDADTDKVIRELPPKEIQELYRRIREAVGLLFDHKI
ncbi:flagellar protein FlaG [Salinispira pacifica]